MSAVHEIEVISTLLGRPLDRNIYVDGKPIALAGSLVSTVLLDLLQQLNPRSLAFTRVLGTEHGIDTSAMVQELVRPYAGDLLDNAGLEPLLPPAVAEQAVRRMSGIYDACRYLSRLDLSAAADLAALIARSTGPLDRSIYKLPEPTTDQESYTCRHGVNSCALAVALFADFAESEQDLIDLATGILLLDIGKGKIDERLLTKRDRLSPIEQQAVMRHTLYGYNLVRGHHSLSPAAKGMILDHHERCDGSGYQSQLVEGDLSNWDLIAAVVDVFDAMTSSRAYRRRLDPHHAVAVLVHYSGTQFSNRIVNHFLRGIGRFPVGTFVVLSNDEIAVVSRTNPIALGLPRVRILFNDQGQLVRHGEELDLTDDSLGCYIDHPIDLYREQT